jgi:RsiW-degrading membrane proteinase PrsW (M82 family)
MLLAFTVAAAVVPSFLLLGYFRARDLYPEPAKVLWTTFALGVIIVVPVLLLDAPLDLLVRPFRAALPHGLAEALFTAALPEELLKYAVVVFFCARHREFDEPMDGIVYGAVASLGFATFENIAYVAEHGASVAFIRAFTAVPGHAFMGAVMGYFVGQWRFGNVAQRSAALAKAYLYPVGLHWLYDFPLLSLGAANRLQGAAKLAALAQVRPLVFLSIAVLALESIWAVRLVNRMRREQVEFTRQIAAAAAAAQGAQDIVALVTAPDAPPSRGVGWLLAVVGGLVTTGGAFASLLFAVVALHPSAGVSGSDVVFAGVLLGGIPMLIGLVMFVFGVKRIHASRRRGKPLAFNLAAAAAGAN